MPDLPRAPVVLDHRAIALAAARARAGSSAAEALDAAIMRALLPAPPRAPEINQGQNAPAKGKTVKARAKLKDESGRATRAVKRGAGPRRQGKGGNLP